MTSNELAYCGGRPVVTEPLPRAWPFTTEEDRAAVMQLLEHGEIADFARGPAVAGLEDFAQTYFGVRYALALGSGTAALHAAYLGLGLGPGDEVLVPTYTFHATVTPLLQVGATPVFCDCDDAGNIDLDDARRRITTRTRALVVVHLWGLPVDMEAAMELAKEFGLRVVEDAAQAHGARLRGQLVGTFGDIGCFSLGGAKMVSGGMGGLLLTDSTDVFERALVLGHAHERALLDLRAESPLRGLAETGFGTNYRISTPSATLALRHFETLEERIEIRTATLTALTEQLRDVDFLRAPATPADRTRGGWYGYKAFFLEDRAHGATLEQVVDVARAEGVALSRPSTKPVHLLPMFARPELRLPRAERLYCTVVGFPDKHFHEPCHALIEQYGEALRKVRSCLPALAAA